MKQDSRLSPGTTLGKNYQIIKMIGQGGMGSVYMAYDIQLDIRVAIKVISPGMTKAMDEDQVKSTLKRFHSEAKLAAKIDHPNVVRIYGFKQDTVEINGKTHEIDYLVMELFAGRTLRNTMDVSGFEYQEEIGEWIEKYMIPLLEGLQKVHELGIIHRDIKPENFLMKDDVPKLADFGLSLGFNFPSVTETIADIYGTVAYMAPEQFYNFSLAREPADIYSMGKILYEVVDGKISEKAKPFKQVKLANPDTDYLRALNSIIMAATEENPNQRIGSARELKSRLLQQIHCPISPSSVQPVSRLTTKKAAVLIGSIALVVMIPLILYWSQQPSSPVRLPAASDVKKITSRAYPDTLENTLRSEGGALLHLIPPATVTFSSSTILGLKEISTEPFYLSDTPVTNQQYVNFLNQNLGRIRVVESEVYLDDRLILKISEKIRGYKPIVFEEGRFLVQDPMHSSCAVLMVTGLGAESYARNYGLRLPWVEEWYYVMKTDTNATQEDLEAPVPVLSYRLDKYGLRGINQVAEWGRTHTGGFVIMGQSPSDMIEEEIINEKDATKYYTDTSFRVARDASTD